MTDLAQKIADAVMAWDAAWSEFFDERQIENLRDTIRTALPVAQGEAVACDEYLNVALGKCAANIKASRLEGELRTASARIAELEREVERLRGALKVLAIGFSLVPHTSHEHLCRWAKECIRDIEALAAQEKK